MGPRAWTRGWTTTQRACGARTLSRASRRPWPSTRPAAAARSSCRTRARCMVRAGRQGTLGWTWGGAWPSPPLPLLSAPSPNRFGEVLAGPPALLGRAGGRVWACKPVCLDPPHKQARLAPSTRVQPTRDTPWLPLLSSPLLAWRFRGDSVGPRNWVSSVCSGLDLNTGPSPRRMSGRVPLLGGCWGAPRGLSVEQGLPPSWGGRGGGLQGGERPALGQGPCGEEGLTSSQASCLPPSATWPTSCLQKGVSPPPCSFLRGLSQGCIFGITQPFCSWLLASILRLSGVGQAISPSAPGVQRRGGSRRETAGLPGSPSPPTGTHPPPARAHSWGRQVFPGAFPGIGATCPHHHFPDGRGSPAGYF